MLTRLVLALVLTLAAAAPAAAQFAVQARVIEGVTAAGVVHGPKIVFRGNSSPEASETAERGSIAISDVDGGVCFKTSGTGSTGWKYCVGSTVSSVNYIYRALLDELGGGGLSYLRADGLRVHSVIYPAITGAFTVPPGFVAEASVDAATWNMTGNWTNTGLATDHSGNIVTNGFNATGTYVASHHRMQNQGTGTVDETITVEVYNTSVQGVTTKGTGVLVQAFTSSGGDFTEWTSLRLPTTGGNGDFGAVHGIWIEDLSAGNSDVDASSAIRIDAQDDCATLATCKVFDIDLPNSGAFDIRADGRFGYITSFPALSASEGAIMDFTSTLVAPDMAAFFAVHNFNSNWSTSTTNTKPVVGLYSALNLSGSNVVGAEASGIGGSVYTSGTETAGDWIVGVQGDFGHYGTATIAKAASVMAQGGTGAGGTVTAFYQFWAKPLYEYSGNITTLVGLQIDDMVTPASNVTNTFLLRLGTPSGNAGMTGTGAWFDAPGTSTIADNGNGGTAAAATITPTAASIEITCSDAQGCDVTMGESGILDGQIVEFVIAAGSNTVNFADTSNVSELAGAFAAGPNDVLGLRYRSGRWVEMYRVNN